MRPALLARACVLVLLVAGCADEGDLCDVSAGSDERIVVTTSLRFVVPVDGVSEGFDLDGRASDASDATSCGRVDFVSPAGVPGIDNQFAFLWGLLVSVVGDAVEGLIEGVINDGTLLLMFEVDGIDDPENDRCVNVHIFQGAGRPDLGTDGTIAPSQTFDVEPGTPYAVSRGRIEGGVLHAGPFDAVIPIAIFQVVADLVLHGGHLRATFDEGGAMEAIVAGGVERAQIMQIAAMAAEDDGSAQAILPTLPLLLRGSADLDPDAANTNDCRQLSTVMSFRGTPAYLYEDAADPSL